MELLKPDYYDEFTCIADKCTISCCREWKINIDDETYRNWKTIQPPSEVPGHRSCLQAYTMKKDGSRIMKMTEEHDCPFLAELPVLDTMDECNELLQDLAVNYRKEGLYRKYLEPVMELAEELSEEYEEEELVEAREDFYRKFRVYEDLLRSFLANEVYSDLLTPEGDLEDALVHMQWIGMEYATIRQAVFLRWQKDGRGSLPYETLRDYMVVISRMTGYEEDDIREYLENSFEELLWEWGYFALITGK